MRSIRISITIPEPLSRRLALWRDRMNISKVCTEAISKEIEMLEKRLGPGIQESSENREG